jgi:branched-chain amino acid transport system permease protein
VLVAIRENPNRARALGYGIDRYKIGVFVLSAFLAGLAGVLAAPMRAVNSEMGGDLIIVIFAVVVIGGLGSVFGSVAAGYLIGMLTAVGNFYVPALSQSLVFLLMALVLLLRPAGLFGQEEGTA